MLCPRSCALSFNILNCTVGSGILALSFAIKESGFGLGIVLSVIVAILCWFALYILIVSGQKIGVYKYAMLCEATMGTSGFYMLNGVIFFQTAGACITYMIVVGDTIPVILDILGFEVSRQWVIFLSSLIFILPLLFYRSIGSLAKVSIVSVMCLPPILFVVAIRIFHYAPDHKRSYAFVGNNVFPAIGVMAFAMLSAQTAFLNFTTMAKPTRKHWAQATGIAVSMSWLISFVFAIIGFIAFGEDVQPNIFNSFPLTDELINYGRGLLGFSMFLTFPQAFYPARAALHKVLGHENNHLEPTDREHLYTTIGLFVPILACGVFISDLGLLYQLIGGFCSTSLAYIFPGLCYFLIFWRKSPLSVDQDDEDEHGQGCFDNEDSDENEEDSVNSEDEFNGPIGGQDVEGQKNKKLETDQKRSKRRHERAILSASESSQHALQETTPILPGRTASYGGTVTNPYHHYSTLSPSSSTTSTETQSEGLLGEVGGTNRRARRRKSHAGKRGETELWMDIGAGMLLVFGVFVMILSTTITLKKMAGYM
ncbi:hypothetical protein BGZ83_003605 [Gryganskiella cystojenkinii]|nr:hypothetical protein BGZ83_003605 [Gryganskiella cystojenkinii]